MISLKEMLNKPVISLNSGFNFGFVVTSKIINGRISAIITNRKGEELNDNISEYFNIPLKNILAFSGDAITLKSEASITKTELLKYIIGNKIYTQTGEFKGFVKDILFEETNFKISKFLTDKKIQNVKIENENAHESTLTESLEEENLNTDEQEITFDQISCFGKDTITLKGEKNIKKYKSIFDNTLKTEQNLQSKNSCFYPTPDPLMHNQKVEICDNQTFSALAFRKLENFASKDHTLTRKLSTISEFKQELEKSYDKENYSKELNSSFKTLGGEIKNEGFNILTETFSREPVTIPDVVKLPKYLAESKNNYLISLLNKKIKTDVIAPSGVILASSGSVVTKALIDICISNEMIDNLIKCSEI